jgi:hypothetical protein
MALPDELVGPSETLNLTFVCPDAIEMQRFAIGPKEHRLGFTLDSVSAGETLWESDQAGTLPVAAEAG